MTAAKAIGISLLLLIPSSGFSSCLPQPARLIDLAVTSCEVKRENTSLIRGRALPVGMLESETVSESEFESIPIEKFVWVNDINPDCLEAEAGKVFSVYRHPKCCDVILISNGVVTRLCDNEPNLIGLQP